MKRLLLASVLVSGLIAGTAVPAFAGDPPDPPKNEKCNSGRGNLNEVGGTGTLLNPHIGEQGSGDNPTDDCDPGNSGDHNAGGD